MAATTILRRATRISFHFTLSSLYSILFSFRLLHIIIIIYHYGPKLRWPSETVMRFDAMCLFSRNLHFVAEFRFGRLVRVFMMAIYRNNAVENIKICNLHA